MSEDENAELMARAQQEFQEFISGLHKETDRGAALVAASVIDAKLGRVLEAFFRSDLSKGEQNELFGRQGHLANFGSRISVCHALGLLDSREAAEIRKIKRIRNDFAHRAYGLSFASDPIRSHVNELQLIPDGLPVKEPRAKFLTSAFSVMWRLVWRDRAAAFERRRERDWVPEERARPVFKEKPSERQYVIVYGPAGPVASTRYFNKRARSPDKEAE